MNGTKYREIADESLSAQHLRLEQKFTVQKDSYPKCTAKTMKDKSD